MCICIICVFMYNMKFIRNLIAKLVKEDKKVLGRWNIENCDKRMNHKIDLSNEDHCGPCGQYLLEKSSTHNSLHAPDVAFRE
jgi:hypothetical protein